MTFASKPEQAVPHGTGQAPDPRPLVIAVENTLLRCDPVIEALIAYLKPNPGRLFEVLAWLWRGRAHLRRRLMERASIDVQTLPVNEALARLAESEAAAGRRVFLASSSGAIPAGRLKERFPFIEGTIEVDADPAPRTMAAEMASRFPQGFEYAGGSAADLDVWRLANSAILVEATPGVARRAAGLVPISARIPGAPRIGSLAASLRLHQWTKNLLVFAPLVLGGALGDARSLLATVVAFLALGIVASSTYLINDILDVAADRRHWSKRERPIAKGLLPVSTALICAVAGLIVGLVMAAALSLSALYVLLAYVGLTLSYSLGLKQLPLIDGLVLAIQFTLRLALGVVAAQVPPSPWLFVFSMFLFTSLSLAKRYTELGRSSVTQGQRIAGRGYRAEDLSLVLSVGVAAGIGAAIIMTLYIIDDAFRQSFYGSTLSLWGFPPLVFLLVCRIWLVTVRGEMHDDPLRFMLGDRHSQVLLALLVTCFAFAWLA